MKTTGWRPCKGVFNHIEEPDMNKNVGGIERLLRPLISLTLTALAATGTVSF